MPKTRVVTLWRCKCGTSLKAVTEREDDDPLDNQVAACPKCGDQKKLPGATMILYADGSEVSTG